MTRPQASSDGVLRTFVAVHLPSSVRGRVADLIEVCRNTLPQRCVRFVRSENLHLTLRFIGNVSRQELEQIKDALLRAVHGARPLALRLGQLGCFPQGLSPRVLWLGVGGDIERLKMLQSSVLAETSAWGRLEDREFHPHLTLGRVVTRRHAERELVVDLLRHVEVPPSNAWSVEDIHLMRSELSSAGSKYSTFSSFPLSG